MLVRKGFIGFFCASVFSYPLLIGAQTLGDRLIMEINHNNYSQRQIEAYYLVKKHLEPQQQQQSKTNENGAPERDETAIAFEFPHVDNWAKILAEVKVDMVVEQETMRVSGFNPTSRMLDKANEIFLQRLARSPTVQSYAEKLGIDERSRRRIFATVLRIEGFRSSKQRQAAVGEQQTDDQPQQSKLGGGRADPNQWQDDLVRRAIVRFFDGAQIYQPIQPVVKK